MVNQRDHFLTTMRHHRAQVECGGRCNHSVLELLQMMWTIHVCAWGLITTALCMSLAHLLQVLKTRKQVGWKEGVKYFLKPLQLSIIGWALSNNVEFSWGKYHNSYLQIACPFISLLGVNLHSIYLANAWSLYMIFLRFCCVCVCVCIFNDYTHTHTHTHTTKDKKT